VARNPDDTVVRWFETRGSGDVALVGGKIASLGVMIQALQDYGIRVPHGFATTADAYRAFLDANGLAERFDLHRQQRPGAGQPPVGQAACGRPRARAQADVTCDA